MPETYPPRALGVTATADGGELRIWSHHATSVELCLFGAKDPDWVATTLRLDRGDDDVWTGSSARLAGS